MTGGAEDEAVHFFEREPLPAGFERWRTAIAPGVVRQGQSSEWDDAVVRVEQGEIEVHCAGGARRKFVAGDLLPLSCLTLESISNPGVEPAVLVAVRRHRPTALGSER